jgi:hypothetical protein
MREVIFVLILVAAVLYTMMHPDQIQSAIDWLVGQGQSVADWIVGQVHR